VSIDLGSQTSGAWLTREELDAARERLPILYIDAIPVRVDDLGEVTSVGLLLRAGGRNTLSRALVSGRVLPRPAPARRVAGVRGPGRG
jgi:hypothetical protein